jgi:hypothetical protein
MKPSSAAAFVFALLAHTVAAQSSHVEGTLGAGPTGLGSCTTSGVRSLPSLPLPILQAHFFFLHRPTPSSARTAPSAPGKPTPPTSTALVEAPSSKRRLRLRQPRPVVLLVVRVLLTKDTTIARMARFASLPTTSGSVRVDRLRVRKGAAAPFVSLFSFFLPISS